MNWTRDSHESLKSSSKSTELRHQSAHRPALFRTGKWKHGAALIVVLAAGCNDDGPTAPGTSSPAPYVDAVAVVQGPVLNPENGNFYYRLANSDWTAADKMAARAFGGHLVSIADRSENEFVRNTFARPVWLGLNDVAIEGSFVYTDGSVLSYTQWEPGEPNNKDNEDFVAMLGINGSWVDVMDLANPPGIGRIFGVVETDTPAMVYVVQGPIVNPANGHTYYRLSNSDWSTAEDFAVNVLGAHLVSIEDAEENTFVRQTFADAPGSGRVWLGLNDVTTEGTFEYVDGSLPQYTNWDPGEPNNSNDEDYVAMYSGNGRWVDVKDLASPGIGQVYGVVEVE